MFGFIRSAVERLQRCYDHLKNTVTAVSYIFIVFIVLVWLSVFLYGSFYYSYLPLLASRLQPVHLEFSVCDDGKGMCSFPTANISLLLDGEDEAFTRGQSYNIALIVELPESGQNTQLGMFMVKLDLYNRVGSTITSTSKSAILHFRSELLRILDTVMFSPMLLFGWMEQRQMLSVQLFSKYMDDSYNPAVGAVIQVQSRTIDLYSTKLQIQAHFTGYRYILFHWPVFSAVFGIGFNFLVLAFICVLSWYQFGSSTSMKDHKTLPSNAERGRPQVRDNIEQDRPVEPDVVGPRDDLTRCDAFIPECDTLIRQRRIPS